MWETDEAQRYIDEIVDLAADDWTDIGALTSVVGLLVGVDAPLEVEARAMAELTGLLIDRGALPGELGEDPDFQPWPGTRQERMDRMEREILELGEMPWPSQIAWFYVEPRRVRGEIRRGM
jgi:hypothetical protein